MSTIKSSSEHLTLNADGSGKEVKIQRNGTQVMATTASGIDVTGNITSTMSSGENKLIVSATAASQSAKVSLQTNATTPGQAILYMGKSSASTNGQVGYNPNNDSMYFYTNNTEKLRIDSAGRVTMPNQPAFHVTNQGYTQMNATGNGTTHTINYKTINYDVGSNFNTSTYTFTAPVDGKYLFTMCQGVNGISSSAIIVQYYIMTSNVNTVPYMWYHPSGGHPNETRESGSMTCHMDANDTAYTTVMITGMGSDTADPTSSTGDCVFTGQLLS